MLGDILKSHLSSPMLELEPRSECQVKSKIPDFQNSVVFKNFLFSNNFRPTEKLQK